MDKNIGKNISKDLSDKYSQKLLDHAKQSVTDSLKAASERAIQKTSETKSNLIGSKITDRITKVSKTSQQNNSEKLQINSIQKHLRKDINLQKKDRKLLMI